MYIEKLEKLSDKRIMFLRPRKFGKTLFTSVLECYYDILRKDKFERLFKNKYIGKNPTVNKNKYHILRFNFSGISTSNMKGTLRGFNIARDITKEIEFNDMLGFSKQDVEYLMTELEIEKEKQEELLPIIKENEFGILKFGYPNEVIREIYTKYLLEYLKRIVAIKDKLVFEEV